MFSFRQKIVITYVIVFFVFIMILFPFARQTVKDILKKGLEDRTIELVEKIKDAPNNDALIRQLKESKALIFFRVAVITNERKLIYDSHVKRILGARFSQEYMVSHPEVLQAFKEGKGYHEEYSEILDQEFAYFARAFDFHGKTYVLRIAFPLKYVQEMTQDFEFGFLGSAVATLLLFSTMTWFIINYLTRPIQEIISAVKPYQEGLTSVVPQIKLKPENRSDEFGQLANTLNSLSVKIGNQINTLTSERNEKQAVLESLVEGVIAVDNAMIIVYLNTMATKFLHLDKTQMIDNHASQLKQEKCLHLLERCQMENSVLVDTLEIKHEGEKLFLDLVAAPKRDKTGAILVLQDKTAHHKIIEMRKDFVANASHELKTPITIIRGFAETLHDNPELPQKTFEEITSKIVNNCEKMNNIIKDLLTLTDIEHIPESRLHECNLLELVENAQTTVKDAHPEAIITIIKSDEEDHSLLADPNLLELAFVNIIENGVKYSDAPAEITISLTKENNSYKVSIRDKGFGIPKKELDNIFQRFYRVSQAPGKKISGSGLGLSIVEMIISKHFGKISVTSELGKGSTFSILLPIRKLEFTEN